MNEAGDEPNDETELLKTMVLAAVSSEPPVKLPALLSTLVPRPNEDEDVSRPSDIVCSGGRPNGDAVDA